MRHRHASLGAILSIAAFLFVIGFLFSPAAIARSYDPFAPPPSVVAYSTTIEGFKVTYTKDSIAQENTRWSRAISVALKLLPRHIKYDLRGAVFVIYGNPGPCAKTESGCANERGVLIQERPKPSPARARCQFDHELTREERRAIRQEYKTYIILHELGHVFFYRKWYATEGKSFLFYRKHVRGERSPTKYGSANRLEDYAESFALYPPWSVYLQEHFPKRFAYFRQTFKRAYPTSISANLQYAFRNCF